MRWNGHFRKQWAICIAACFALSYCGKKDEARDQASAGGKPQITANAPVFNFGKVKEGAKVEHVFKIKNAGTSELTIQKATGS